MLGLPPMPWQQTLYDVAGELDPDTLLPVYDTVIVSVMRQQGKTASVLTVEVDRCVSWPTPQRAVYTAQTGRDAAEKLLDDQWPMIESSPLRKLVRKPIRKNGAEAILFKTGSRIQVQASSESAGHGKTVGLGVIDEAFKDDDDRREQALLPAMTTVADAQLWITSAGGTIGASPYWYRQVDLGRAAVLSGMDRGICYVEFAIPEDQDVYDPEVWWQYMPALGWTVNQQRVQAAADKMEEPEFRRAYGNQRRGGKTGSWTVIVEDLWAGCQDELFKPDVPLLFGIEVLPDLSAGAVAASDGRGVELIDARPGTAWMVRRGVDLFERWGAAFAVDAQGPAKTIGDDLEDEGVEVIWMNTAEVASACVRMYRAIADGQVKFRPDPKLTEAAKGAARKPLGDRFVFGRATSSSDVTPLLAGTLAFEAAHSHDEGESLDAWRAALGLTPQNEEGAA